jgi:ABC-type Fe3+ transport system substrate-binding protein
MKIRKWLGGIGLLICAQLVTAAETVVVVTSYPQEVVSQFEKAFEHAYPQYRLEILWRQSRDVMSYLHLPHSPVDVYWAPAQRNFAVLAREGAFRKLDMDLGGLPKSVGGYQISDPDGYFAASEIAGFGMAFNPDEIHRLGLSVPSDWKDLAELSFQGHVALPIPSRVGYAPMLMDTLLQGYGWDEGWSLIRQIAANAVLAEAGATFISDDVGSGRVAVGATIDFFAVSAAAHGKPVQFSYPEKVGYSPAHVAIFKESTNIEGARTFAAFVLSEQGQKILFHPDIRKLPIRPAVYASKPEGYFDPFAAAARSSYPYDLEGGLARQELVVALFDVLITRHHEMLASLWKSLHEAVAMSPQDPRVKEALLHANWMPVSLREAGNPELQQRFSQRADTPALETQWEVEAVRHYSRAIELAQSVLSGR